MSNDPNVPFEATTIYHNATTFYFGSNFNLNGEPRIDVARALIRVLEDLTDLRAADNVILLPLNGTARGCRAPRGTRVGQAHVPLETVRP